MDDQSIRKAKIRAEFCNLPILDLWEFADADFLPRDDADSEFLTNFFRHQGIARELTRHQKFCGWPGPKKFTVPKDPLWSSGLATNPAYEFVDGTYPGITSYIAWARECPPDYIWSRIARYDLWQLMEKTLLAARAEQSKVRNWSDINDAMRRAAILLHLGLPAEFEDLRAYRRFGLDEDEAIAGLNRVVGLGGGS